MRDNGYASTNYYNHLYSISELENHKHEQNQIRWYTSSQTPGNVCTEPTAEMWSLYH